MPRKSTASAAATDANGDVSMVSNAQSEAPTTSSPKHQQKEQALEKQSKKKTEGDATTVDDLLLPRTLINRIARGVLPANTSIQKDAILALSKSATVFISHLAAEANEMTDRKTIQSADVIKALREIEMAHVMNLGAMGKEGKIGGRVELEVEAWEGNVRGKRRGYRDKIKARDSAGGADTTGISEGVEAEDGEREEGGHENKRRKRDSEGEVQREIGGDVSMVPEPTSDIVDGTNELKLGLNRRSSGDGANDEEDAEDVEDSADEDEDDQQDEDEEEQQEETQELEDSIDVEETSRRRNGTLAPDGRIEVGGSDDESDEEH